MSEKMTEVYDKYDIEILGSRRGRGATILTTTKGLRILEPFRSSVGRLEQEHVLKGLLEKEGFSDMDLILPNRNGELITYDRYHQPFVLKKHYEGNECDMRNVAEVVRAVQKLAEFHACGKKVAESFWETWEQTKQKKRIEQIEEMKQILADGEELEQVARMYGVTPAALREMVKEPIVMVQQQKDREAVCKASKKGLNSENIQSTSDEILEQFQRHNRELRKIRRFVGTVKRKNTFETLFLRVFPEYYNKGLQCEKSFSDVLKCDDKGEPSMDYKRHYGICHGNYNQHNVIMGEHTEAIVHFERFSCGNQLEDLYQFGRKVMEKNHFDYELLEVVLNAYAKKIELTKEDYRYLYVLFSYPEKFWKIANSYYNTNKAFLSPKFVEKLETLIQQEKEKSEMLSQYSSFHLT